MHTIYQLKLFDSRIGPRLILDFASGYPQMLKDMNIGKDSDNQPGTSGEVQFWMHAFARGRCQM